jgi:hypothetical protein
MGCHFMHNVMFSTKLIEVIGGVLSSMIIAQSFNFPPKAVLHLSVTPQNSKF